MPARNTMSPGVPDLTHAHWLLYSQEKLIQNVNPNISTRIMKSPKKNLLFVSNVSEEDIDKLYFLVNTDQNNNYLYMEKFSVSYQGFNGPLNIPGLETIIINNFRQSDIKGFVAKDTLHHPFNVKNFVGSSFKGKTFSAFVDQLAGLIPFAATTSGRPKLYAFVLNPDDMDDWTEGDGGTYGAGGM